MEIFSVSLCVLCASVVKIFEEESTTETQRIHGATENTEIRTTPPGVSPLGGIVLDYQSAA